MANKDQKIKYINQLFGQDVVSEFGMSEADIDFALTMDHAGENLVELFKPIMEAARNLRLISADVGKATQAVLDLKESLEKGR